MIPGHKWVRNFWSFLIKWEGLVVSMVSAVFSLRAVIHLMLYQCFEPFIWLPRRPENLYTFWPPWGSTGLCPSRCYWQYCHIFWHLRLRTFHCDFMWMLHPKSLIRVKWACWWTVMLLLHWKEMVVSMLFYVCTAHKRIIIFMWTLVSHGGLTNLNEIE